MSTAVAAASDEPGRRPLLLTTDQAARELYISRANLFRLVMAGDLGSIKLGKRRLIPYRELEAFIERNTIRA